jgi:hypothetical protein
MKEFGRPLKIFSPKKPSIFVEPGRKENIISETLSGGTNCLLAVCPEITIDKRIINEDVTSFLIVFLLNVVFSHDPLIR